MDASRENLEGAGLALLIGWVHNLKRVQETVQEVTVQVVSLFWRLPPLVTSTANCHPILFKRSLLVKIVLERIWVSKTAFGAPPSGEIARWM